MESAIVQTSLQGRGEYVWPNGDRYTGDFAEGVKDGNGILYFANGDKRVRGVVAVVVVVVAVVVVVVVVVMVVMVFW